MTHQNGGGGNCDVVAICINLKIVEFDLLSSCDSDSVSNSLLVIKQAYYLLVNVISRQSNNSAIFVDRVFACLGRHIINFKCPSFCCLLMSLATRNTLVPVN